MQQWEYKYITRNRDFERADAGIYRATAWLSWTENDNTLPPPVNMVEKLADLGFQGWELVSVTARSGVGSYALVAGGAQDFAGFTSSDLWVFKRPLPEGTPPKLH